MAYNLHDEHLMAVKEVLGSSRYNTSLQKIGQI